MVHSVHHGPVTSDFTVSGTTYAPEGFISDASGLQVRLSDHLFLCKKNQMSKKKILEQNRDY